MQRVARAPLRRTDAAFTGKEEAPDRSELNPGTYWSGNTGFEPARRIRLPSWPLGLLVDPRHGGGSQSGMDRYTLRPGAFFEMPADSGREADRAWDGPGGLRGLPRAAPSNVDG